MVLCQCFFLSAIYTKGYVCSGANFPHRYTHNKQPYKYTALSFNSLDKS